MVCCELMQELADQDYVRMGPVNRLPNGRILTEIDTEYFLAFGEGRPQYYGLNYCPFCGRILSRGIWNAEKKKQGF